MKQNTIRIGTRPSKLAQTQTELVISELKKFMPGLEVEMVIIKTSGDKKQGLSAAITRDKRDWIEELEAAILKDKIDFAVHSGKDVPFEVSPQTCIHSILDRADSRDVFIGAKHDSQDMRIDAPRLRLSEIKNSAIVGTASLRRKAQLLLLRPDLKVIELRGNVTTRLEKLDSNPQISGIILAAAGLERLSIATNSFELMSHQEMLPASAQGILTVQYKTMREDLAELTSKLQSQPTEICLQVERAVVRRLGADCSSALSVFATCSQNTIQVEAKVFSNFSPEFLYISDQISSKDPETLGERVADALLEKGARRLLESKQQ